MLCGTNHRYSIYIDEKRVELQGEINKFIIIEWNFKHTLLKMDRSYLLKINFLRIQPIVNRFYLEDIYKIEAMYNALSDMGKCIKLYKNIIESRT